MLRTAIKGVLAHKLRLALTALAVVLGVAFVAGTYVFTDTIEARFDTLFDDVYAGVDATVRPQQPEFGSEPVTLDEEVVDQVLAVDGVAVAEPSVMSIAQVIGADGEPIGGQGPPTFGFSWIEEPALNPLRIKEGNGRAPTGPGEVVIDAATVESAGFALGDTVQVQLRGGVEAFELVGIGSFGTEDNLAGATISAFELNEAQRLFGLEGRYTQIDVLAADGIDTDGLIAGLSTVVPAEVEVVTGEQQTAEQIETFTEGLGFLQTALLAFAAVAVFVGAFIIQNTFRIIVAQRTRELAMLRAVGATGRQVVQMVLAEAVLISVIASAIGIVAGIGLAEGLKAGMDALGFGAPDGPLTVELRTIAVAVSVGVVVTVVSALLPARAASAVPPVAAMRETEARPARRSLRNRAITGAALSLAGAAGIGGGLVAENGASLPLVAFGALAVFLGVSVLAPLFARPVAAGLGAPLRGVTGLLARENTRREPRRTASTASALMIGVALVAFVSIFGASIKASITDTLETAFPTDLAVQSDNFNAGVSSDVGEILAGLDELGTVSAIQGGVARIDGDQLTVAAIDPATAGEVYSPGASIDLAELGDGLLVQASLLDERGWHIGQEIGLEYPTSGTIATEIVGTFDDQMFAPLMISSETHADHFTSTDAVIVFADVADGVDVAAAKAATEQALAGFPSLTINTKSDQIAEAEAQIDQLLVLFTGLLGLALVIAVIGIANTLALSIVERTREIGLLRAVGMGRRQVRSMIRWEAVITALFGAVLGIGLGTVLGWSVVAGLADDGLGSFSLPLGQLTVWLLLAAAAGVVAAILPARKASRLDVLRAIAYE